jgi:hypothetical protein
MALEDQIDRLETDVQTIKDALAKLGTDLAAAFGNDLATQVGVMKMQMESKEQLCTRYRETISDMCAETVEAIKVLGGKKRDNGLKKGELLEIAKAVASRTEGA